MHQNVNAIEIHPIECTMSTPKAIICYCHVNNFFWSNRHINIFLPFQSSVKCWILTIWFTWLVCKTCITLPRCHGGIGLASFVYVLCNDACDAMHIFFFRERQPDADEDSLTSSPSYPLHDSLTLSAKQEDADNQKNSSRASQAGLNSNAVHIPVTVTAPPGDTTIIPSK